ncbi:MAG: penicillin-binding protein [Treponema porcinum]|uniref:penicillin-binding protein n=2 Tax=Treponema porcinum TaxID=261392 RepID=UPI0023557FDA|nr:penicillin-binding protein [Treponema porcinum]MCI6983581.1 transpeptidase family protein [Treponema porcinum]MCI7080788.1 transpeptidase family protein [Treponema porcinum]MCI7533742.1 transpeptidase family protein [Treponema porcinum]MCI7545658.1 transpeptidase family protein [Treponema porcinum]MDY4189640.1 penicillin-binding protein [Treponema porcinum]
MNGFFNKKALIGMLAVFGIFVIYVLVLYAKLAFTPVSSIVSSAPPVQRGSIVDRNGKPLAVQTNFYHVGVTPHLVRNKAQFADDVSGPLGMESSDIMRILEQNSAASFVYLKKKITQTAYAELKKITDAKGYVYVNYDRIPGRIYPENALASQLIGYMGDDGKGLAGIEYSMQSYLQPSEKDGNAKESQEKNVYLTIDANLQYKLEEIARDTMRTTQAESMMLIAADAKNGEILSYISLPSANLNEYSYASVAETVDRPAMEAYEPGSVFKIFTVSVACDQGLIRPDDSFLCDGMYERRIKGGEAVRIKCLDRHGWLTARDALKYSCNDVLGQISDRISDDDFIAKIRALGFGQRTEIELPGETYGSVKDSDSALWSVRSKPTIAIGQEISVSALQMVQAATAIANKGIPLKLTLVKRITNKDGSVFYEHTAVPKERVLKQSTAEYVLSCMETTATSGTGSRARLNDISLGVKTGTAQMASKSGGYSTTDFLSNCMAIFPVEDPQIILYIVVEKAKGETYAGRIVAPVIAKAADEIIDYLGMSRGDAASLEHSGKISISAACPIILGKKLPDFTGLSKRDIMNLVNSNGIQVKINGSGWVKSQNPAPGTPVSENMIIELNLE